jgi:hypothetical protein
MEIDKMIEELFKFHYFIVMPNTKVKVEESLELEVIPQTVFNMFDTNLINSTHVLKLISELPFSLREHQNGWPLNTNLVSLDDSYQVHYVYENNVLDPLLNQMDYLSFGFIYILKGVAFETVDKLLKLSKLPVVSDISIQGAINLNRNTAEVLYEKWTKNFNLLIQAQRL